MSSFGPSPFSRRPVQLDYGTHEGSPAVVAFFNAVYMWMAIGLALTGAVGYWVSSNAAAMSYFMHSGILIILLIAELVLVATISMAIQRLSATAATALFLLYAGLNGITLSGIFLVYTHASLIGAFAATAAMFGVMSVYGMFTRSDLSGMGKIAFMGLIGIIVASIVNIFLHSPTLTWIVSYVGVAVFVALTAYDTQRLRQVAISTAGDAVLAARLSISGALMLYLDFLNLFLMLLQIMGDRRN